MDIWREFVTAFRSNQLHGAGLWELPEYIMEQSFAQKGRSPKRFKLVALLLSGALFLLMAYAYTNDPGRTSGLAFLLITCILFPIALAHKHLADRKIRSAYLNGIEIDAVVKDRYMGKRGAVEGALKVPRLLVEYEVYGTIHCIDTTVHRSVYDGNRKGEAMKIRVNRRHPSIWVPANGS